MTEFPIPDRVINIVEQRPKWPTIADKQSMLEFLDCHKQKFDWENDNLEDSQGLVEYTHP